MFLFLIPSIAFQKIPIERYNRNELIDKAPYNKQIYAIIKDNTDTSVVNLKHVLRCAYLETRFDKNNTTYNPYSKFILNSKSGNGIFQVTPIAAKAVWKDKLNKLSNKQIAFLLKYNIRFNIETAIKYIELLYAETKNWEQAYSMYNQGNKGKKIINKYARYITRSSLTR